VEAEIKKVPSRFRHSIGKYKVLRGPQCKNCATCVVSCPEGVHFKAGTKVGLPKDYLCMGPDACQGKSHFCVDKCPNNALTVSENPMVKALGDYRWTADLLMSTWYQAETGDLPPMDMEYRVGNSGGGFDKLRFRFPKKPPVELADEEIDTSIELNKRGDNAHKITIPIPWYQGGMSFGSVSNNTMVSRAAAAKRGRAAIPNSSTRSTST
jgi:NAD-dependent dihydropyrimidine dehydrogenase PreA subunit